jgi:splicing factor 3A subunit 1
VFALVEIADKTAAYVAGNNSGTLGAMLEERLRQSEKNNAKFCFLNPTDPYHAYYAFKVKEARAGKGTSWLSFLFLSCYEQTVIRIAP